MSSPSVAYQKELKGASPELQIPFRPAAVGEEEA